MIIWRPWEGIAADWDAIVINFHDYTIHQGYAWGEHQQNCGWSVLRLVAFDDEALVGAAQVLTKLYKFKLGVFWIPGGPLGFSKHWDNRMLQVIKHETNARLFYCRLSSMMSIGDGADLNLLEAGWVQSSTPLSSGLSFHYSLSACEETRLKNCSSNWRHNLRRALKRDLVISVWQFPDPEAIVSAYRSMQLIKNLSDQTSLRTVDSILRAFGEKCLVIKCEDMDGNILALRGALLMGHKALDIFAATTLNGRKTYASYAVFWQLMSECESRGISSYDLAGVDPINNRGVFDFKKGTGAELVHYLGEWDTSEPKLLRKAANSLLAWKAVL